MERVFRLERESKDGLRLPDANLYLGDQADGDAFQGERLCVLEHDDGYRERRRCIRILLPHPTMGMAASRAKLDEAAEYITAMLKGGQDLIVHCGAGIERSPLMVA